MSDDAALVGSGPPAVRLVRHLPHPPSEVWHAITDRHALGAWFPCDVEVAGGHWTPGAALTFRFPPEVIDLTMTGEVLLAEPPSRLAFTWGEETLRFELIAEEGGTRLVLVDELPPGIAARNAAGWDECLDHLAGHETAEGWKDRFDRYVVAFTPSLGPQEGPPSGYRGG
jgi:uncharacterized protein YndB with AHSA1/START domain